MDIEQILKDGDHAKIRGLFSFIRSDDPSVIEFKFRLWSRYFFPKFFKEEDAPFHSQMDLGNIEVYRGDQKSFLNIAFRGSAKTTRTKLFVAYTIANDREHYRKYFKVLSKDLANSKQSTTDVYNLLIAKRVYQFYPEIFERTESKREETMASFTTATGVKMIADTIGSDQRGQIQDESRPDFLWFDDIETRVSLMSATITHKIWANMDEAITGLSKDGGAVYTANYISERGNVHKLVGKIDNQILIPIQTDKGEPTWVIYSKEDIEQIKKSVEDFEGDYLCKPSAGKDVYFDRESLDKQVSKDAIEVLNGLRIYKRFNPMNRYCSGHDVAGGVGLDSSTSVFLDLDSYPVQVVATYHNNEIKPDVFAHEIVRQAKKFGECYVAPEANNLGSATLAILKTIYPTAQIHKMQKTANRIVFAGVTEYGWDTNSATKPAMLADLSKAVEDGLIELNDPELIREVRSYTTGDLMDKEIDPRMTTRHFDLVIALAIAWAVRGHVRKKYRQPVYDEWEQRTIKNQRKNPAR